MSPDGTAWWAKVNHLLPDDEELAAAVSTELGEPHEDVLPSVATAMILRGVGASLDELRSVLDGERARARARAGGTVRGRRAERVIRAGTLDGLQREAGRLARTGGLDLATAVAIQRTAGAIAARSGLRLVLFLARLAVIRRLAWDACVDENRAGRLDAETLGDLGRWIFLWTEVTSLVVTDGYRAAEREILARDAQARRGAIEEILGVVAGDALTTARIRRVAGRFGLDPDGRYRLAAVAPRPEADPTPERTGIDHDDLELLAGRIGHLLGSAGAGLEGAGADIRLPVVLAMRGRIVVLARAERSRVTGQTSKLGTGRIAVALNTVLGGPTAAGSRGAGGAPLSAWVAVGSAAIEGVDDLGAALADLVDATRTAEGIGLRGWIADPGDLAVERLLLAHRELGDAAVDRELGTLLADERLGTELVETLQVYFDAGENMRETARRLHLANRTVAYRVERIEALLGGPLDDAARRRVSVALLVLRLRARPPEAR
jgi:hypothetical protein